MRKPRRSSPGPGEPSADLFESIEKGDFPRWKMFIQVMPEKERGHVPLPPVRPDQGLAPQGLPADRGGVMELNRNPENYFAEVEQAAFNPANIVPASASRPTRCSRAPVLVR